MLCACEEYTRRASESGTPFCVRVLANDSRRPLHRSLILRCRGLSGRLCLGGNQCEEVTLRVPLLHDLQCLPKRRIVLQVETLRRGITTHIARNALCEKPVDVTGCRV